MDVHEQRLAEVLRQEAERVVPAPDALARIQQRVAAPAVRPASRRRVAFGVSVVGLAAALALVVGLGLHPGTTSPPVQTPGPVPSAAPTYDTDLGRSTVDVYRVRDGADGPRLAVETVAATAPYDPRQAVDALFGLKPLADADASVLLDGDNVVASTRETADALVLDMSRVDQASRAPSPEVARLWVQAWVRTLQSAYSSDKPVLITLRGRPTELYGSVGTSRPIASADDPTVQDQRIFVPRPEQEVTSPVSFGAGLPTGDFTWTVTDQAGRVVDSTGYSGTGGYGGPGFDLPAGRYRATVAAEPGSRAAGFRRTVDFVVTGPAAAPSATPVSDPATGPLDLVAAYWALGDGRLTREWRTRRDPATVLTDYLTTAPGTSGAEVSGLDPRDRVSSVTQTGSRLTVDFSVLRAPARGSSASLRRQAAAFARTVQSVVGADLPVAVTLAGEPVSFLGQPASAPLPTGGRVSAKPGIYPQAPHDAGRAEVVGVLPARTVSATYLVNDGVSEVTRYQGTIPLPSPRTGAYAFSLAVPSGRYQLEVTTRNAGGDGFTTLADLVVP